MSHKKSLFANLIERRVPQILGMYIAAVWLAVEIGDWMSERFDVPQEFSSYVFVIMISFIPLVGLLAWGHGRPGRDKWTQKQILFIPINAILAYFAVTSFIKPAVQATEIMSLVDESTGQVVDYEVAKSGLNQKVAAFFWENKTGDESLDWLSYGAMWMVSQDLMRSPIITIQTPYDSDSMLNKVRNRGYEDGTGEPLSLDLSIADDKEAKWMIKGQILKDGQQIAFEASLYDVVTGALVKTITSTSDDWFFALDDVAEKLGSMILEQANIETQLIPDIAISEHVSNNLAAVQKVIKALNAVSFENNYAEAVEHLNDAIETDQELAEAYVLLIDYYRSLGDFESAKKASEEALKLDFKLYQESIFKVKANYYAVNGEQDKAIKVLENWVKLYPESAEALQALGNNYMIVGNRLEDALAIYNKLSELQDTGTVSYLAQAKIYRMMDDKENALKVLNHYQSLNDDEPGPLIEMAEAYLQFGDLNKAKEKYEEASLMSINGIKADLGLAKIMALQGQIDKSLEELDKLVQKAETDAEKVTIMTEKETILFLTGQLHSAMELLNEMKSISKSFMPPLAQILTYSSKEVAYLSYLKKYDESWDLFEKLRSEIKPPFDQLLLLMENNLHIEQGNYEEAAVSLDNFETFLKEFQMTIYDQFVYSAKAVEMSHSGQYEQAIALHDLALQEAKQSIISLQSYFIVDDLKLKRAKTLMAAELYEEAIEQLDEVIGRNPLFGQCYMLKAKALKLIGENEEAKAVISKLKVIWQNADSNFKDLVELENLEASLQTD